MCYEVIPTEKFLKDLEYYEKKKKFKHIEDDVDEVIVELEKGNLLGDELYDIDIPSEESVFKVRVANSDTKQGKSNGYRIIYYVIKDDKTIYLLTVYYKKEDKHIPSKKEIANLVEKFCS